MSYILKLSEEKSHRDGEVITLEYVERLEEVEVCVSDYYSSCTMLINKEKAIKIKEYLEKVYNI